MAQAEGIRAPLDNCSSFFFIYFKLDSGKYLN